jgi:hypothetical protein
VKDHFEDWQTYDVTTRQLSQQLAAIGRSSRSSSIIAPEKTK